MENVVYVGFGDVGEGEDERTRDEVQGEYVMAWMWVEGWKARLRAGGDVVERCRMDCVVTGERSYS